MVVRFLAIFFLMCMLTCNGNLLDFSEIYNDQFSFCISEKTMRSYYEGNSFGRVEKYTLDELKRVEIDAQAINNRIRSVNPDDRKVLVLTAGAPGAGKSTLLEQFIATEEGHGRHYGYTDPDCVCLKHMEATWGCDVNIHADFSEQQVERAKAYDKWRPASNAIAQFILAKLASEGKAICLGTTSSNPEMGMRFKFFKDLGYRIHVLHVTAPDHVRWGSIQERDRDFIQTTQEDVEQKRGLVIDRLSDAFLKYVDQIDFYYRSDVRSNAVLTAEWKRIDAHHGELNVIEPCAYEKMKELHNHICKVENKSVAALWENSIESTSLKVNHLAKAVSDSGGSKT